MTDFNEWLSRRIGDADAVLLNAIVVPVSPDTGLGLTDLLGAWWEHLSKFEADLSLSLDDHSVWGVHDYIAALIIRDHLARAMLRVEPILVGQVESVVAEVDRQFMDFTECDEDGCTERTDGRKDLSRGWWWKRVPMRGPVREELRLSYGHESDE